MVHIFGLMPRWFLKLIDLSREDFYLVGTQIIIMWACGALYSHNSQYTKNHTIKLYKGVWVYYIFDF